MTNVKKNLAYNITYQILIIIIPLITTPYITRVIGKEGLGIYSYTYSIAHYFVLFSMLGINNYGNRLVAKYKDDKEKLSKEVSSLYVFQFILGILFIFIYMVYINIKKGEYYKYSAIQSIYLASVLFDINWIFFGLEKFKITISRNIIIKIITTICVFIFVKNVEDVGIYILILTLGTLISQLLLWFFVKKEITFIKPKLSDIKKHFKPNLILFIPVIAVSLYKIMDKIMLGNMSDIAEVGLYESAEKIVNVPLTIIAAFGTVMLPRTTNLLSNNNLEKAKEYFDKAIMSIIFMALPIIFGTFAIADKLTILYLGKDFINASVLIKILSITVFFTGIANVIRTQYLIPKEKDKEYIISVFMGAVINVILNLILIPIYKAKGAAIGTACAEFTVCLLQVIFLKDKTTFMKNVKLILQFIISSVIMYLIIETIGIYIKKDIINMIVKIMLGAIIYIGINNKYILQVIGVRKNETKNINI